jgi:hypothetical protein
MIAAHSVFESLMAEDRYSNQENLLAGPGIKIGGSLHSYIITVDKQKNHQSMICIIISHDL